MDRRLAAGFLLAGVTLAAALVRTVADERRRDGVPVWRAERSYAGVIEVGGAVRTRGLLANQAGRLARDAITLSGPKTPPRGSGSATRLREGDEVTLRADGTVRIGRMPGERLVALGRPIDLNLASSEDLASLPGIGPASAARIVAWRTVRGSFGRVENLRRIPGIGPKTLARVRPFLTVGTPSVTRE